MHQERQAHGMQRIKDNIYCCGGLARGQVLGSCERFSLVERKWTKDVPDMAEAKFSMTMMVMDNTWLYSFGGLDYNHRARANTS